MDGVKIKYIPENELSNEPNTNYPATIFSCSYAAPRSENMKWLKTPLEQMGVYDKYVEGSQTLQEQLDLQKQTRGIMYLDNLGANKAGINTGNVLA